MGLWLNIFAPDLVTFSADFAKLYSEMEGPCHRYVQPRLSSLGVQRRPKTGHSSPHRAGNALQRDM